MNQDAFIRSKALEFPWSTSDPFLFCAYHRDHFPAGNADLGPAASLDGRQIGMDFTVRDGWRMYHGDTVPGFPGHPHRGFETVTVVREGVVDHADSLGAAGRYGTGDTQWMTAGRGVQHSEMFPLLRQDSDNPLEMFQVWLNLPPQNKMVEPHFAMLWREATPRYVAEEHGRVEIDVIAGRLADSEPPAPPPASWAADPDHHVAIWILTLAPHAAWTLPAAAAGLNRSLYFYRGSKLTVAGRGIESGHAVELHSDREARLENGDEEEHALLLQGKPIDQPVAHYGPFVMNTREELQQAFQDYRRTEFGGWPWPRHDMVHAPDRDRFALHADGREESPESN